MQTWQLRTHPAPPHQPQILHSQDGATRVILLTLPAGEQLQEHQVHEHALVAVIDGEVEISAGGERQTGGVGTLVHFAPAERHDVRATSDARLALFLSPWPGPGHPSLAAEG